MGIHRRQLEGMSRARDYEADSAAAEVTSST
jgi:hypothetical protein